MLGTNLFFLIGRTVLTRIYEQKKEEVDAVALAQLQEEQRQKAAESQNIP